jgi:hypothetical protein
MSQFVVLHLMELELGAGVMHSENRMELDAGC